MQDACSCNYIESDETLIEALEYKSYVSHNSHEHMNSLTLGCEQKVGLNEA